MNFWNDIYAVARPEKPVTQAAPTIPPAAPPAAPPPVGEPTPNEDNGGTTEC